MCSVIGCVSPATTQCFKLPTDPDTRLEWVQFLARTNGQYFKESSWTEISICRDHFTDDCFEKTSPVQPGFVRAQLQSSAVPSLGPKLRGPEPTPAPPTTQGESTEIKSDETTEIKLEEATEINLDGTTEINLDGTTEIKVEEITKIELDDEWELDTRNHPEESLLNSQACEEGPVLCDSSCSTDVSYPVTFGTGQMQQKVGTQDLEKDKSALPQTKGKYLVNESCLLQLFRRDCPSCGSKCKLEKVIHGTLVIMNQQCLQCEYRHQWKSQAGASLPTASHSLPTAEGQVPTGGTELSTPQETPSDDANDCSSVPGVVSEITFSDEERDSSDDDGEESEGRARDSDWDPDDDSPTRLSGTNESGSDEDYRTPEEDSQEDSPLRLKLTQLCPECGTFISILKPHTCEYKIKPYSCNICGKRCVNEKSLKLHSIIHSVNYKHPCKFCLKTFKTKLDKLTHQQSHAATKKPYRCTDCSETFAGLRERNKHLQHHRGSKRYVCKDCNREFRNISQLERHSVVHTGAKPFECDVCRRSFNQPGHLKSHMRVHTGEKPYQCRHCDKSFNHNVSLKSHVQRFHGRVPGSAGETNAPPSAAAKDKTNEVEIGVRGGAQEKGRKRGVDDTDGEEEEEVEEEEVEEKEERADATQFKKNSKNSTGRPLGRPKRNARLVLPTPAEAHSPKPSETFDVEQSDSDPAEENETKGSKRRRSGGRTRGRTPDSDSDFDPAEERKKKKTKGTRGRGRPKKNPAV